MNFKRIVGVLSFMIWGFIPKVIGQHDDYVYQSFLIKGKDTLTMWETFINPYPEFTITSNSEKMYREECISEYFFTWKIENDSLFLVDITDYDLAKNFKKRCINGRVFGKEINYQVKAKRYRNIYNSTLLNNERDKNKALAIDSFYNANTYITIKDGKLVDQTAFGFDDYPLQCFIARYDTDWARFPFANLDANVVIKVKLNENGQVGNAQILRTMTHYLEKVNLEDIWKKEILRQIKLLKLKHHYREGKIIHQERIVMFRFKSS